MAKIRVTMTTNTAAAHTERFSSMLPPHDQSDVDVRFNGGKLVILSIPDSRVADFEEFLDDCHIVREYQTTT